jgi:predicted dehydrogenase
MKPIRWGLIGCGDVATKRVAQAIQQAPASQLVAACRRTPYKLAAFCRQFQVPRAYIDAQELLEDDEIDAVYLATPVHEHLPHTLVAAAHGKHVLVEKPMALSVAQCDAMIAACRQANVRLGVAYYRRFYPLVARMQQIIQAGQIGSPLAISAVTATPFAIQPREDGYWRALPELGGGGALMDIGSHRIDIFRHFFGEIVQVQAMQDTLAAEYQVEDSFVALFRFAQGLLGTLQCHFGSTGDPDELAITGTKGRLVARPLNGDTLLWESSGKLRKETHAPPKNLCGPMVADFVAAVREQRAPLVNGEVGRATNAVMEQAYALARKNAKKTPDRDANH